MNEQPPTPKLEESGVRYAHKEFPHAKAFAEALVTDAAFRSWVLKQTKFAALADTARLLHGDMLAKRSAGTRYWWNSHFQEKCRCCGCSGHETDLLAIFEADCGLRFALHVEVKRLGDRFKEGQAAAYPVRARCWIEKAPRRVLPHSAATTALLFSELDRDECSPHLGNFEVLFTLEDIAHKFPTASPSAA